MAEVLIYLRVRHRFLLGGLLHHITYQTDAESLNWCLSNTHANTSQQYLSKIMRQALK